VKSKSETATIVPTGATTGIVQVIRPAARFRATCPSGCCPRVGWSACAPKFAGASPSET
jgi:hypothetical protein